MSRSDRDQRDAEKAARRARRLAERAEQRARRRAEQARRASERAGKLAERASRKPPRKSSLEDYVDGVEDYADKWSRKAEEWFGGVSGGDSPGDDEDADLRARRRARRDAARARRAAEARAVHRRRRARGFRPFRLRFNSGRGLYRDKARGKVLGVCAGLADYLDVEVWQVRLIAVLGLIFAGQVAVPVYFIMYFLMDDKPYYRRMTDQYDDDLDDDEEEIPDAVPPDRNTKSQGRSMPVTKPAMSNVEKLRTAKEKFSDLEERLRSMESHVTSSRFELQRELRKISGEDA